MRVNKNAILIGLFIVGVGCLYAGEQSSLILLTSLGLICFGLILLVYGIGLIRHKRLEFQLKRGDIGPHEVYTGISAQLWGVYFALMGILLAAFAVAYGVYPGGPEKLWSALLGTHVGLGMILFLIGLMVSIDGAIRLIAGTAGHNVVLPASVGNCLERFGGGIVLIFGLVLIGIGIFLVLAPGAVESLIHTIIPKFISKISESPSK
jgi:hypothetical protein